MTKDVLHTIQGNMAGFSKGQKRIAGYILSDYDKAAFMTAGRLGALVGVSESTVVRFATEIGYSGYPAMQQAVQEMIRNKMTSFQRLEMTARNIPPEKLLDAVLGQDIDILRRTREGIDAGEFYRAADALVGAKRVFVMGAGSSLALATFLFHYLQLVFDNVLLIEATSEAQILQQLVHVTSDDAIIAISFPRYSKKAARALKYASSQGMTAIAITDSKASPLAQSASHVLLARSDMVSFVDSLVGPLSVINALIVTTAIRRKTEVAKVLEKIEGIWDEYGVYEKVEESGN